MNRPRLEPHWNILIATLGQRSDRFVKLLESLLPQVDRFDGAVRVTALWNNGERPLAHVRQALVTHAVGSYVSFVDDDDELPANHVSRVLSVLNDVDYVGWRMQCIMDGVPLKPTFHSLKYPDWSEDDRGYYRDVSHLNPVRRTVALEMDFRRGEPPEDVSWADQLRGKLETEAFIDEVMYVYRSSTSDSTWRPGTVTPGQRHVRPVVDDPNFNYHPWSST